MVVSSGSFANLVSFEMVNKLNLPRIPHIISYISHGLDTKYWLDVKDQAHVPFTIGSFSDAIMCDIVNLKDFHMVLGRDW